MAWQARVSYAVPTPQTEEGAFDLIERLLEHAAIGGVARDLLSGTVTLTVDAPTPAEAASLACELVLAAAHDTIGPAELTGVEIKSEAAVEHELLQPLYPDVVGYSEIADMAGVSRQAARLWGSNPTFPPAVIETAQGPLRLKAAVQAWIEANPPRRRRTTTAA